MKCICKVGLTVAFGHKIFLIFKDNINTYCRNVSGFEVNILKFVDAYKQYQQWNVLQ